MDSEALQNLCALMLDIFHHSYQKLFQEGVSLQGLFLKLHDSIKADQTLNSQKEQLFPLFEAKSGMSQIMHVDALRQLLMNPANPYSQESQSILPLIDLFHWGLISDLIRLNPLCTRFYKILIQIALTNPPDDGDMDLIIVNILRMLKNDSLPVVLDILFVYTFHDLSPEELSTRIIQSRTNNTSSLLPLKSLPGVLLFFRILISLATSNIPISTNPIYAKKVEMDLINFLQRISQHVKHVISTSIPNYGIY